MCFMSLFKDSTIKYEINDFKGFVISNNENQYINGQELTGKDNSNSFLYIMVQNE